MKPKPPRISERTGRPICGCGTGYMSAYDGKCGHCRTKADVRALHQKIWAAQPLGVGK